MDKDTEKLQTDLRFAAAFLKAHEEVKAMLTKIEDIKDNYGELMFPMNISRSVTAAY